MTEAYQFHSGTMGLGKLSTNLLLCLGIRKDLPILPPRLQVAPPLAHGPNDIEPRDLDDALGLVLQESHSNVLSVG